jgi:CheY-like chemotaxis protein
MPSRRDEKSKKPRRTAAAPLPLILVVDDYGDAREVYARVLSHSGFRVAEAASGSEAIEKSFELLPDLILMDLAMPGMDGWEAIRRLKADARTRHSLIVVLTGAAYGGGAQKAKQAGCDAYLVKPCLPETLIEVSRRLLSRQPSPEPASPAQR